MRVLVVDINMMGDLLMSTPAIRALTREYGPVDVLTLEGSESVVRTNHNVAVAYTVSLGKFDIARKLWRMRGMYDMCVHLNTSQFVNVCLWLTKARVRVGFAYRNMRFGLTDWMPTSFRVLRSAWRQSELYWLLSYTLGIYYSDYNLEYHVEDDRPIMPGCVVFAVTCRNTRDNRFWLDIHWAKLARLLTGQRIVFTGLASDRQFIQNIIDTVGFGENLAGRYTFDQLACLIKGAKLLVTLNSAPAHLGVALGTPTVVICGGTPSWVVYPSNSPTLRAIDDPALANWNPRTGKYGEPRINEITPTMVMEKINELIG